MDSNQLATLRSWFDGYSRSFLTGDSNRDSPITLKIDHTHRVHSNIRLLAQSIGFANSRLRTAEAIGLLHDAGRFEQYRQFGTFNDRRSINHAALGIHVVEQAGVLKGLGDDELGLIVEAIRFHNAPALPSTRPPLPLTFMRLIRDADKLDIWKVFADFYRSDHPPEAAIVQHLVDQPVWEPSIVQAIMQKRLARFSEMKSVNDFKLLQLSWVFDLNFPETFAQAQNRTDLALIAATLPDAPELNRAVSVVMARLREKGRPA